ncbi:MAG: hypothetical protein H0X30_05655 [Anaerolineae bacterium]|nr:hypothetical protein [Anaerolineae bacterium]
MRSQLNGWHVMRPWGWYTRARALHQLPGVGVLAGRWSRGVRTTGGDLSLIGEWRFAVVIELFVFFSCDTA